MTTTMKCHYEILGVPRDATAEDFKKAYRKLALQWHPDKNPDKVDEVTKYFLLVQQAYDVLSDPQERAWYDKHREAILRGGHGHGDKYEDDSLDVFQYFNTACFTGYKDDDKGFYAVYKKVFTQIAEEDYVFMEDREKDFEMPDFGDSKSSYEEVVGPFYAYWESFYTAKSYVWEEKYDTREAPDRRVRRVMEAENKKLRDAARKERSEEVKELVAFVRKRDKRVQAYRKKLEERASEIAKKNSERREKQIKERLKCLENYEETGWSAMSGLENEMQKLEANLAEEFGDQEASSTGSGEEDSEEEEFFDSLFCVACNRAFKSEKAFANHEKSKKHKENVSSLKSEMEDEEGEVTPADGVTELQDSVAGVSEEEELSEIKQKLSKKQKKRRKQRTQQATADECDSPVVTEGIETIQVDSNADTSVGAEKTEKDCDQQVLDQDQKEEVKPLVEVPNGTPANEASLVDEVKTPTSATEVPQGAQVKLKTGKGKQGGKSSQPKVSEVSGSSSESQFCNVCRKEFPTRNKLFQHVKAEGHAIRLSSDSSPNMDNDRSSKKKGRRKGKN